MSQPAEIHFSIQQVAALWGVSTETVRGLFAREEGVLRLAPAGKREYLRIPMSVLARVHARLSTPAERRVRRPLPDPKVQPLDRIVQSPLKLNNPRRVMSLRRP